MQEENESLSDAELGALFGSRTTVSHGPMAREPEIVIHRHTREHVIRVQPGKLSNGDRWTLALFLLIVMAVAFTIGGGLLRTFVWCVAK